MGAAYTLERAVVTRQMTGPVVMLNLLRLRVGGVAEARRLGVGADWPDAVETQ